MNNETAKDDYFVPENALLDTQKEHLSPSGKYRLITTRYKTKKGCWDYSQGLIYNTQNNSLIAEIRRNHGSFPFTWIENHLNTHDYLIGGENYQGQTIIELDTGKRADYLPARGGFCWVKINPSPKNDMLAVEGCYWAFPYEIKIFDFSDPLNLPLKLLYEEHELDDFLGWIDDNSCSFGGDLDYCVLFDKFDKDLTDEEYDIVAQKQRENDELPFGSDKRTKIYELRTGITKTWSKT